ncbi:MAG TPA: FAD-dependent oxidoreductase, partial [Chryseosolibacter sp.]
MRRRNFIELLTVGGGVLVSGPLLAIPRSAQGQRERGPQSGNEYAADVVVAGGGLGGVAAALAALRNGLKVILTEETDWIGGQISQQGVPPD